MSENSKVAPLFNDLEFSDFTKEAKFSKAACILTIGKLFAIPIYLREDKTTGEPRIVFGGYNADVKRPGQKYGDGFSFQNSEARIAVAEKALEAFAEFQKTGDAKASPERSSAKGPPKAAAKKSSDEWDNV